MTSAAQVRNHQLSTPHSALRTPHSAFGQAFIEYVVMLGLVAAALVGISTYAKRGLQSAVKIAVDDMSPLRAKGVADPEGEKTQLEGIRAESGDRNTDTIEPGTVLARESAVVTATNRTATDCATTGCEEQEYGKTTEQRSTTTTGALTERGEGVSSYGEVVVSVP